MNAVLSEPPRTPTLEVQESRDFKSYHAFLRAARNYMEGPLVAAMYSQYEAAAGPPAAARDRQTAENTMDGLLTFQLYSWAFRNLQRFKYHRPDLGIFAAVQAQRDKTAASAPPAELRLNPALKVPAYFQYVPFHQHTGGVTHDELDGICYEIGRRTTVPSHMDPNGIYHLLFNTLPTNKTYHRVLDWGTGHGGALITWQRLHPESECHGVDLAAPCLKLAHQRAREQGLHIYLSQQDLEHLDYADNSFDLIFFNFMLHELPPANTPALLREAYRVLKPGGLFAGHEFNLRPGDAFQNVLQRSHAWLNNETYSVPWYETPLGEIARETGFKQVRIEPFERLNRSVLRPGKADVNANYWDLYQLEK